MSAGQHDLLDIRASMEPDVAQEQSATPVNHAAALQKKKNKKKKKKGRSSSGDSSEPSQPSIEPHPTPKNKRKKKTKKPTPKHQHKFNERDNVNPMTRDLVIELSLRGEACVLTHMPNWDRQNEMAHVTGRRANTLLIMRAGEYFGLPINITSRHNIVFMNGVEHCLWDNHSGMWSFMVPDAIVRLLEAAQAVGDGSEDDINSFCAPTDIQTYRYVPLSRKEPNEIAQYEDGKFKDWVKPSQAVEEIEIKSHASPMFVLLGAIFHLLYWYKEIMDNNDTILKLPAAYRKSFRAVLRMVIGRLHWLDPITVEETESMRREGILLGKKLPSYEKPGIGIHHHKGGDFDLSIVQTAESNETPVSASDRSPSPLSDLSEEPPTRDRSSSPLSEPSEDTATTDNETYEADSEGEHSSDDEDGSDDTDGAGGVEAAGGIYHDAASPGSTGSMPSSPCERQPLQAHVPTLAHTTATSTALAVPSTLLDEDAGLESEEHDSSSLDATDVARPVPPAAAPPTTVDNGAAQTAGGPKRKHRGSHVPAAASSGQTRDDSESNSDIPKPKPKKTRYDDKTFMSRAGAGAGRKPGTRSQSRALPEIQDPGPSMLRRSTRQLPRRANTEPVAGPSRLARPQLHVDHVPITDDGSDSEEDGFDVVPDSNAKMIDTKGKGKARD